MINWLVYWIAFGIYSLFDHIEHAMPIYWLVKAISLAFLWLQPNGAIRFVREVVESALTPMIVNNKVDNANELVNKLVDDNQEELSVATIDA
jgi:hypothetical protein